MNTCQATKAVATSDGSLSTEECFRLLRTAPFGRVVATEHALPLVLPVNFALDGHSIVFRTAEGSSLAAATANAVVAFEADEIDAASRTGWSVVVTGMAHAVESASELVRVAQLGLVAWVPGERQHYVRITPGRVTGRRLEPPPVLRRRSLSAG